MRQVDTQRADGTAPALLFMLDPAVPPPDDETEVPLEAVAGAWDLGADGVPGRFRANPMFEPFGPDSPSDPADLVLRALGRDDAEGEDLLDALAEIDLDVAVDDAGSALVAPAPDGMACVLATTAPVHRAVVEDTAEPPVTGWRAVTLDELGSALPGAGIDVLLNPRGPAPMRLTAAALRDAAQRARKLGEDPASSSAGDAARSPSKGAGEERGGELDA